MALRCDLHKWTGGKFNSRGGSRVFGNTKDDLGGLRGQRDEAIQEHWIENQVKLKA